MTAGRLRQGRSWRYLPAALMMIALAADVATVAIIGAARIQAGVWVSVDLFSVGGIVLGATFGIVGWIIASRRPDNSIGWIFLAIGLSQAIDVFASAYAAYGLVVSPGSLPFGALMSWVAAWAWAPGFTLLVTLSVLLFPDGQPPSERWRPVVWASFIVMALLLVPIAVASWPYQGVALVGAVDPSRAEDLGVAFGVAFRLFYIGLLAIPFVALSSVAGMVVRFRRAGPGERQQLKWFTYAAVPEIAFVVTTGFVTIPTFLAVILAALIAPLLPVAAAIAILRYRLYEIDRIVSRTIAYAVVTGLLVATYASIILLVQGPLGQLTGGDTISVALSTLAAAALFQPVLRRVQRVVDRRFHRARFDAERTAAAFSERLRGEVDLWTVTTDLDTTIQGVLAPSRSGVWLRGDGR